MKENQNVEWKQSWRDEHLKWICGFANAEGGTLMIGKNDRGEVVGIANAARLLEDIPNKVSGIDLIRNTCTAQGSLAPHFECESTGFGIEVPLPDVAPAKVVGSKGVGLGGISKTSVKTSVETPVKTPVEILRCLGANPSMTLEDVATKIEKSLIDVSVFHDTKCPLPACRPPSPVNGRGKQPMHPHYNLSKAEESPLSPVYGRETEREGIRCHDLRKSE